MHIIEVPDLGYWPTKELAHISKSAINQGQYLGYRPTLFQGQTGEPTLPKDFPRALVRKGIQRYSEKTSAILTFLMDEWIHGQPRRTGNVMFKYFCQKSVTKMHK